MMGEERKMEGGKKHLEAIVREERIMAMGRRFTRSVVPWAHIVLGMHPVSLHMPAKGGPTCVCARVNPDNHMMHCLRYCVLPLQVNPRGEVHQTLLW